jgi:hypothetical protein
MIVFAALSISSDASASAGAGASPTELGAGVGASPLELSAPAHPGGTYQVLPKLLVVNTGTASAHYQLRVERLSKGPQRTLPADWIQFAANDFQLAPKGRRSVVVRAIVPSSAIAGSYESDVVVTGVVPHGNGQAAAGAAAATTVSFTVKGGPVSSFPWSVLAAIGGLVLLVAFVFLVRRSGFRLKVERR